MDGDNKARSLEIFGCRGGLSAVLTRVDESCKRDRNGTLDDGVYVQESRQQYEFSGPSLVESTYVYDVIRSWGRRTKIVGSTRGRDADDGVPPVLA